MSVSQSLNLTQVSQSIEDNYSKVRILWISTQSGESHNLYKRKAKYYVSINGAAEVVYSVSYTLPKNSAKTILDKTITVPHTAEGKATVKVRTWMDTDISAGVIQKTAELTLQDIPRATTPTFFENTVDMGETATIYMYRASDGFTHDLAYSFAGSEFLRIANDLDTVYYWNVPDLADKIPTKTSGTVTIRCITKNGDTVVGTKTALLTVRVPGSVMPTISDVKITEATEGLAAQFGAFVKDKSTLAVSITAAGAKGSTIKAYSTTVEGMNYTEKNFTTDVLTKSGEVSLVTTVTDTRDRSVRLTTKINVLDYFLPVTEAFTVYRVDANGNAKNDGNYAAAVYSYKVAPVGNKNKATMTIEYKRSTATSWETLMTSADLSGAETVMFDTVITSDYQFDIMMTVVDWFGSKATYEATLPTAKVILDIKAEGDGLAAGKTAEFSGFEIAMSANGESFLMAGVRNYSLGDAYGHVLYNNGLLIQWGAVTITPTAVNTVTSAEIVFPIPYKARPHISGTLMANTPQLVTWGMGGGDPQTDGLVIFLNRSTLHSTAFRWMAVGLADSTRLPEVTTK